MCVLAMAVLLNKVLYKATYGSKPAKNNFYLKKKNFLWLTVNDAAL